MLHDSNRDHFEEQDDTNRDHFKSQGCGLSLRRNANIDHGGKSHRYHRIPKLLSTLMFLAVIMAVVIIEIQFYLNRSYPPLHSSLLSNYANFLKTKYKSIVNPKWPPLSSDLYILLDHFPTKMLSLFLIIISTITRAIK